MSNVSNRTFRTKIKNTLFVNRKKTDISKGHKGGLHTAYSEGSLELSSENV